jgi:actin
MKCPELLFNPQLDGKEVKSIHALTWNSIQESDVDVRKSLCANLILSGGTTMYEGLADRLKDEIIGLAPAGAEIKVIASADRKFAVWKGASTFASLSTFAAQWITKGDYDEHGTAIVGRRCPNS